MYMHFFSESQKVKNGEKSSQPKSANSTTKLNGEGLIGNDDSKKDNIGTKETIVNGTDNTHEKKLINGDPKTDSDCDISSSIDNAKVVTNGTKNDSDDTTSIKSDETIDSSVPVVCPIKAFDGKQMADKKKENKKIKVTVTDKPIDSCKKDTVINQNVEKQDDDASKKVEKESDKLNGDGSKIVNGEKTDRESTPSEDGDDKKRDPEVLFIQDMGFTVKIVSPGAEPLDIQVGN